MFGKHTLRLFLMIVCIFYLLTGCTININIGNSDRDTKKETELCTVIATSEDPEYLEEICNMAIDLLGEKVADLMGLSCKVVECAGPAQEIETN